MHRGAVVLMTGKVPLAPGGHESYVRAHALAASRLGLEPHLFCLARFPSVKRTELGVIHRVAAPPRRPPPALLQVPLPAQFPWLAYAAARFLGRAEGPRLIHGFGIYAAAAVATRALLERRGLDAVAVASAYATRAYEIGVMQAGLGSHHGRMHRLRYRAWLRWVLGVDDAVEGWGYAHSHLVLVNYESVGRLLSSAYGPRLNLRRIPYCSPAAFHRPLVPGSHGTPDDIRRLEPATAPLIVCVSRHDPRKGIDRLLVALHQLRGAGIAFRACLVGPGKLLEAHRRLAAHLSLDTHVALLGAVDDPARYLRAADIFVLPSLAEASGSISVLDALQSGTAVVASACDGIPEDLTHELDSLLVAPGDPGQLASALGRLLNSPTLRARLSAGARGTYEARFAPDGFVSALGAVYEELGAADASRTAHERIAWAT